jgi:hypothetical protein
LLFLTPCPAARNTHGAGFLRITLTVDMQPFFYHTVAIRLQIPPLRSISKKVNPAGYQPD